MQCFLSLIQLRPLVDKLQHIRQCQYPADIRPKSGRNPAQSLHSIPCSGQSSSTAPHSRTSHRQEHWGNSEAVPGRFAHHTILFRRAYIYVSMHACMHAHAFKLHTCMHACILCVGSPTDKDVGAVRRHQREQLLPPLDR